MTGLAKLMWLVGLMTSVVLSLPTTAESVTPANIAEGKLVHGSNSPDGKFCLLEVFHSATTQNSVIFATTDRKQNLGFAPLSTEWATDRPYARRTTIVWAPDSRRIATHDTLAKNSTLKIHRLADHLFQEIPVPDLLAIACQRWKIESSKVVSSGQRPLRWDDEDILRVQISAKIKGGQTLELQLRLHVPKEGNVVVKD